MSQSKTPLRVGVTGHRLEGLAGAELPLLRAQVRRVLACLRDAVGCIEVISPLAEGADQIAAEEALALGCALHAPLPFLRGQYVQDFTSTEALGRFDTLLGKAASVEELDGSRESESTKVAAYRAVGVRVLESADLLLAIWNGGAGREAGTAEMVARAMDRGLTIVWIDSRAPHRDRWIAGNGTGGRHAVIGELTRRCSPVD